MSGVATEVRTVEINSIVRDDRFQPRVKMDPGTVQRYAGVIAQGGTMPPVRVVEVRGVLLLVDGWHRVAAAREAGRYEVEAEVSAGSLEDAAWLAARANMANGLPMSGRDVREAFRLYVRAGLHRKGKAGLKSYREITADLFNVKTHGTIRSWMLKDFPKVAARMSDEGYGRGDGGLKVPLVDPEAELLGTAMDGLNKALAVVEGLSSRFHRGEIVEAARRIIQAAEAAGPVVEPEF